MLMRPALTQKKRAAAVAAHLEMDEQAVLKTTPPSPPRRPRTPPMGAPRPLLTPRRYPIASSMSASSRTSSLHTHS